MNNTNQVPTGSLIFDCDRMYRDIIQYSYKNKLSQRQVVEEIGISRATLYRISIKKPITMEVFLKILNWSKHDINRYITTDIYETTRTQSTCKTNFGEKN